MPNHCHHRLVILGPREVISDLITLMQGESCFDFSKLIAMPAELVGRGAPSEPGEETDRLKAKYGHSDWYSWNCATWGTKWNAYDIGTPPGQGSPLEALAEAHAESPTREIEYTFQTAWSPPLPVLQALVERFPTCTFTWYGIEEQPAWGALITFHGGEQVDGGICEGSEHEIWAMSEWHAAFAWEDEDDDEDE